MHIQLIYKNEPISKKDTFLKPAFKKIFEVIPGYLTVQAERIWDVDTFGMADLAGPSLFA
jgi:hypothetical protein